MNLGDIQKSNFLKKDDFKQPQLMTIIGIKSENVAKDGAEADHKPIMHFSEVEKGMVLNSTNAQIIAALTGCSEDIEIGWRGYQVVVYNDPTVSFGGRITGGLRVRAPKQGMKKIATEEIDKMPKHETADDLPF